MRQQLDLCAIPAATGTFGRQIPAFKIRMLLQKRFDLLLAFGLCNGANRIDQNAAHAQMTAYVVQNLMLQFDKRGDIFGFSQQLDLRMTAQNAKSGAWRIDQNHVEWCQGNAAADRQIAGFGDQLLGRKMLLMILN